jgi:hypothetical protein
MANLVYKGLSIVQDLAEASRQYEEGVAEALAKEILKVRCRHVVPFFK